LLAPLLMVAIEVGMPQMFPYYLAISQAFVPIVIQIADLTGPLGVTALLVALNGALLDAWRLRDRGIRVAGRGAAASAC
jgi:apolipoprotein N-acyltransferase